MRFDCSRDPLGFWFCTDAFELFQFRNLIAVGFQN